jgi:hypothetical protein
VPASAANEILINEVELNPPGTDSGAEKVELYNPSSSATDVSGWTVSSTAGSTASVVISEGTAPSSPELRDSWQKFTMAR